MEFCHNIESQNLSWFRLWFWHNHCNVATMLPVGMRSNFRILSHLKTRFLTHSYAAIWLRGYVTTWLRGYLISWLHGYIRCFSVKETKNHNWSVPWPTPTPSLTFSIALNHGKPVLTLVRSCCVHCLGRCFSVKETKNHNWSVPWLGLGGLPVFSFFSVLFSNRFFRFSFYKNRKTVIT
jgi:hypothetical protein